MCVVTRLDPLEEAVIQLSGVGAKLQARGSCDPVLDSILHVGLGGSYSQVASQSVNLFTDMCAVTQVCAQLSQATQL